MEREMKKVVFLIMTSMLAMSCLQEGDKVYWYYADSYIYEYVHYDEIILYLCPTNISVRVVPVCSYGAFSTSEVSLARYKSKCDLYGDIGYKLAITTLHPGVYEHSAPDRDLVSVRVFSNKDYLDGYPAGSDLSSLYCMASRSPYKYIESGYTLTYDIESADFPSYYNDYLNHYTGSQFTIGDGVYPVFGPLSDLTSEDMKLLGFCSYYNYLDDIFSLYPVCLPDDRSVHEMTVELHDIDGNVLTASVEVDFSKVDLLVQN